MHLHCARWTDSHPLTAFETGLSYSNGRKNKTRNSWRVLRKPRLEMLLDYPHKSRRAYLYALWCISSARYTPYPSVNHPDKTIPHCAQPLPSFSLFPFAGYASQTCRGINEARSPIPSGSNTRCIDVWIRSQRNDEWVKRRWPSGSPQFVNSPISIRDRKLRENGAQFRLDSPETFGE